jgi:hypothetical protein
MDLGYEKGGWWNTSREVEYFEIVMIAEIGGGRFKRDKMYGKVFEILWERHDVKYNASTCDVC